MKTIKKLMTLVIAFVMCMTMMSVVAMAQTVDSGKGGSGSITITNAAKGETYSAYMLFEATVATGDKIAYKGSVPEGMEVYFEETSKDSGYVQAKAAAFKNVTYYTDSTKTTESSDPTNYWTVTPGSEMSDGLKAALTSWKAEKTAAATAVSDGSALTFSNLVLGYYVVTTSQGDQAISVDSTQPNVNIIDKNTTAITAQKSVDDFDVSIGQTVTYTATFDTTTYVGDKQVKSYTISDTLPNFLSDVKITSVRVVTTPEQDITDLSESYKSFGNEKKIVIPWVGNEGEMPDEKTSLYKNGAKIVITYTATVTSTIDIDGKTGNVNKVTITPNKDKTGKEPFDEHKEAEQKIFTYAAALQKVDENKKPLAGAEFTIAGLVATGDKGVYTVSNYYPTGKDGNGKDVTPTTLTTDADGQLVILGIASDEELVATETKAPNGYNKLTGTATLKPEKTGEVIIVKTARDIYYDANGNVIDDETTTETKVENKETYSGELLKTAVVVVNNKGTELPSTGGMGTTIFYVVGTILVLAAVVLLITKKRMHADK